MEQTIAERPAGRLQRRLSRHRRQEESTEVRALGAGGWGGTKPTAFLSGAGQ